MTSHDGTDCTDLLQATKAGDKVKQLIQGLRHSFRVEDITPKEGYSDGDGKSRIPEDIREEFKKEFVRSKKLLDIIKAIIPPPTPKKYYLSYGVRLLLFRSGWSNLEELVVNKDDCVILIPVYIIGSATGTLKERATVPEEEATVRKTTFICEVGSELVVGGRCSIAMEQESEVVCVVLTMGKDKE